MFIYRLLYSTTATCSQFLHKAFHWECLLSSIFSCLVLCSVLKMSWWLSYTFWVKFFWNIMCYLISSITLFKSGSENFVAFWSAIFSALIGSLARPKNCANALHKLSHLIITTTLWNKNYFLHFIVKTEAQGLNDPPTVIQLHAAEHEQTRAVKPRSIWLLRPCSWQGGL